MEPSLDDTRQYARDKNIKFGELPMAVEVGDTAPDFTLYDADKKADHL
ncbi:MAG: hypothetical protein CM1200mP15_05830 [Dehalococcoidia bacterium]|nr:MAG: hypothetical protein CM1200mP15_05830 [Dehalococcoidia bacterium]